MITVRVIKSEGWQNGKELIPYDEIRELDCDEKRIEPWIKSGVLEIVAPEVIISEEDPAKERAELVSLVTETVVKTMKELAPDEVPFTVKDRSEDDPNGGFTCLADFAHKVWVHDNPTGSKQVPEAKQITEWDKKTASMMTKTTGHMAEYDAEQGGHLVPAGFVNSLYQRSLESAIVRPRAQFIPCATNSIGYPALMDYDHRPAGNGLFGAVQIKRPGEAELKNPSKPNFEKIQLTLHKIVILTYVSDELLEDSPISIEPLLTNLFGQAIGWHEDNDFINGTGTDMSLGIMNAGSLITRTRQGYYLNYLDVCSMWSSLWPMGQKNAIWLVSPSLLPYLFTMCAICLDSDGSDLSCGAHPVYVPGNGASGTPYATIFGRPVITTEHCQAAGTTGDIILADFSQYLVAGKAGRSAPSMDKSMHLRFDYDKRFVASRRKAA